MTTTPPTTIPEVAASVARDIREHGHFQRKRGQVLWGDKGDQDPTVCVLYGPTMTRLRRSREGWDLRVEFDEAVRTQAGSDRCSITWNDETPTEEVLAVLDALASLG